MVGDICVVISLNDDDGFGNTNFGDVGSCVLEYCAVAGENERYQFRD